MTAWFISMFAVLCSGCYAGGVFETLFSYNWNIFCGVVSHLTHAHLSVQLGVYMRLSSLQETAL